MEQRGDAKIGNGSEEPRAEESGTAKKRQRNGVELRRCDGKRRSSVVRGIGEAGQGSSRLCRGNEMPRSEKQWK